MYIITHALIFVPLILSHTHKYTRTHMHTDINIHLDEAHDHSVVFMVRINAVVCKNKVACVNSLSQCVAAFMRLFSMSGVQLEIAYIIRYYTEI